MLTFSKLSIWKWTAVFPNVCHLTTSSLPLYTHSVNELTSVSCNLRHVYICTYCSVLSPSQSLHFPPYYTAHESVLLDVCWIPSGIESLLVTPEGGVFPLQSEGSNSEGDEDVIQLHVPQGAVRAVGEGVLEVRYAVIPDGPFRTPEGYRLCSMTVYLYYDPAQTTNPFYLLLPHWSGAPGHPTFVTSPHTLSEGEDCYSFHLQVGGEFDEGYGILEVDGHSTLFGQAYRLEDTSRYYASYLERQEGTSRHLRVAIVFESNVWIRVSECKTFSV